MPEYTDVAIADGGFWYSSCSFNGLFFQEIESGKIEFVGYFPEEEFWQENLYRRVILMDRELIFIPFHAKHISIYHLDYRCFTIYSVPNAKVMGKYVSAVLIDNEIYLFPACAKKAIIFDIKRKIVLELEWFNEIFAHLLEDPGQKFYLAGTVRFGEHIFLALKDTDRLICYGYQKEEVSQFTLGLDGDSIGGMTVSQDRIYISTSKNGHIMCLDPWREEKKMLCQLADAEQQKEGTGFPILQYYEKKLFFHFMGSRILYKLDIAMMKVEKIILTKENGVVYLMERKEKELLFLPCRGHSMYRYNIEEEKIYKMPKMMPEIQRVIVKEGMQVFVKKRKDIMIHENEKFFLADYLDIVPDFVRGARKDQLYDKTGKEIWDEIKRFDFTVF